MPLQLAQNAVVLPAEIETHGAVAGLSPAEQHMLTHIRMVALKCRVSARKDLFHACALLTLDREKAQSLFAETLVSCLPEAMNHLPVFYRPGVNEMSFDEAWLMRLCRCLGQDDLASAQFLLNSRIAAPARRNIGFLAHQISEQFSQV